MQRRVKDIPLKLLKEEFEQIGGGYQSSVGSYPAFSYEVIGLNDNLSKGNSNKKESKFHLLVGDYVKGICVYDEKEYSGKIQRFYKGELNGKNISYVYIITDEAKVLPLYSNSVKRTYNRIDGPIQANNTERTNLPGAF